MTAFHMDEVENEDGGREYSVSTEGLLQALELRMQECFRENLKRLFPDQKIRGQGKGRGMVALF